MRADEKNKHVILVKIIGTHYYTKDLYRSDNTLVSNNGI